ncbi:DUF6634 family protein [Oharaeibacter diazotrophicus]|uniref:Uncharacterized protein n=1 Tax=Oharaeibacter diazotrophicus TaxID=1920512 RepID=A0A4R6RDI8_9HYPH|nr:DUF6634 family protein [Oharaeibacter diazotrophicus]TDP84239.1 hypothetical protein EDD54_2844 [Oharaeibacter diazotrophicus]BBE73277.1 hypothetical protein OHA_1_02886 [Pleomorphomonas sp. SM30]GLS75067.1 hypothetical protein GCM10007904_04020 [Oharaeibacter diazotrophicus]
MFLIDPGKPLPAADLAAAATTLRALAADMDRLAGGTYPTKTDLDAAPILDRYQPNAILAPVLCGAVTGHPILTGTGRLITTSPVYLLDPVTGWARTYSRLYRLGRPASDAGQHG